MFHYTNDQLVALDKKGTFKSNGSRKVLLKRTNHELYEFKINKHGTKGKIG